MVGGNIYCDNPAEKAKLSQFTLSVKSRISNPIQLAIIVRDKVENSETSRFARRITPRMNVDLISLVVKVQCLAVASSIGGILYYPIVIRMIAELYHML